MICVREQPDGTKRCGGRRFIDVQTPDTWSRRYNPYDGCSHHLRNQVVSRP